MLLLDEYQTEALRTAPRTPDSYPLPVRLAAAALENTEHLDLVREFLTLQDVHTWAHGLAGESGEVCDLLKKVHGHGVPMDVVDPKTGNTPRDRLKLELGDVLWYLANLATSHGFKLSEVAQANADKLRARYPTGFNIAAAAAKADER